ncbi:MAG: sulfatase, partial [Planctomycetes bacterium]|nr:sulfatase [Planctomycetota bacterium]
GPFNSNLTAEGFEVRSTGDELGPAALLMLRGFLVRREDVGAISIEIRQPFGEHFDLIWSRAGMIRIPIPDNKRFWTLHITTDGFAEWTGRLNEIAVRTDGTGKDPVEIRSFQFLPREDAFREPVGVARVSVNREIRSAIYTHCPATLAFHNITVTDGARLQVGLGQIAPYQKAGRLGKESQGNPISRVEFEIIVEHDGNQVSVLKKQLAFDETWIDVSTSLEEWNGKTITLSLKATSDTPGAVACWANPVVYVPVRDPPCVIIYLIDALGAKHIGLYGYDRQTMPRLSAFAAGGVWFAQMFANSPRTIESVPDLMLSMPTERHGVFHASIAVADELVTLADALRAAGFATASFCTNVNAGPRQNMDQGFDHFVDRIAYHWNGRADRTVPIEEVMAWLNVHRDRPTFLYIHTAEPHAPYTPPATFAGRFDADYQGSIDGTYHPQHGFLQSQTDRDVAHVAALYDEEVAYADAQFGRFLDALARAGRMDATHIFVIADHGEEFREHGTWGHGRNLHGEVMRIPLVIAGPEVTARGRLETQAQLFDLMPTILDIFDLPEPYPLAGESLVPILRTPVAKHDPQPGVTSMPDTGSTTDGAEHNALQDRTIFASTYAGHSVGVIQYAAIETGRWKLMYRFNEEATMFPGTPVDFVLFDLLADSDEQHDVLDANRDVARRIMGKLIAWRRRQAPFAPGSRTDRLMLDPEQLEELRSLGYIRQD